MQESKDFIILKTEKVCKIRLENEHFCRMWKSQISNGMKLINRTRLHNLQSPVQNENMGSSIVQKQEKSAIKGTKM